MMGVVVERGRYQHDVIAFAILVVLLTMAPAVVLVARGGLGQAGMLPWFLVMTSSPAIAAALLWAVGRRRSRGDGLGRVRWASAPRWLSLGLFLGAAPVVLGILVDQWTGGSSLDLARPGRQVAQAGGPIAAVAMLLLAGPLVEEPGWRGYLQPRLRAAWSPVAASGTVGVVWAVWHLPLYLVPGTGQAAEGLGSLAALGSLVTFVPLASLFWFVTERARGGVAGAVSVHVGFNAASALLGTGTTVAVWAQAVVALVLAVGVHVVTRLGAEPGSPVVVRRGSR